MSARLLASRPRFSNRKFSRLLVLAGVAVAFVIGLAAGNADAFPLHKGGCDGINSFGYEFTGANWNPTRESLFNSGAAKWEVVPTASGGAWVNAWEGGGTDVVTYWGSDPGWGYTTCSFGSLVQVGVSASLPTASFEGVATHEVGHVFGLAHTGPTDSWDGAPPTMTPGCEWPYGSNFSSLASLQQDDWEALESRNSPWSFIANESFEYNPSGSHWPWGTLGGESISILTGGAGIGNDYARIYGYSGAIFQTARVTDPGDMRAAFRAKRYYSTSSGYVWAGLYARRIDYASNGCDYARVSNWDLSQPSFSWGTSFVYESDGGTLYPTSSWQQKEGPGWTEVDDWEGLDVRVYVYNFMTHEGGSTYVRIDDARVRHLP